MRDEKLRWSRRSGMGCDPVAMHGAPVSFTGVFEGILPGQSILIDQSALASGYRSAYWLDEIRMQAVMQTPAAPAASNIPAYACGFQFRAGSLAFSKASVPMMLYQPQYAERVDNVTSLTAAQLVGNYSDATSRLGNCARWLLPKPLFMSASSILTATVTRDLTIAATGAIPWTVAVTYIGRALPPGAKQPLTRNVPWVASYTHDFANLYSQTGVDAPFRNPFTVPLQTHRWIGRPFSKGGAGATTYNYRNNMLPDNADTYYAAIDIWDSTGYRVTQPGGLNGNFTPVGHVFDAERCVWAFNRPLGPREQYDMAFQTLGSVGGTSRVFAVALHGSREEGL